MQPKVETSVPVGLVALTLAAAYAWQIPLAVLAVLSSAFGVLIERRLFFAEAQHVVTLYYGARTA